MATVLLIFSISLLAYRAGRYIGAEQYKKLIDAKEAKLLTAIKNPPNVLNNIVWPAPEDPRWEPIQYPESDPRYWYVGFKLGNITVSKLREGIERAELKTKILDAALQSVDIGDSLADNHVIHYWMAIAHAARERAATELLMS